jgi:hypothetical protein
VVRTATAASPATVEIALVMPNDRLVSTRLDFLEDGLTQGDREVFRGRLFDLSETRRMGRVKGECVVVSNRMARTSGLWRCSYLLELPEGDVIAEGLDSRGPGASVFAILGGTEAYRTVAGDADFVDTPNRTEMYLHLEV